MAWLPRAKITSSRLKYKFLYFLYHYVPAFFADIVLTCKGSKLSVMKIYSKIYYHVGLYEYFISHSWKFSNENIQKVYAKMSEKDQEEFPTQAFNHEDALKYSVDSYNGLRKYIMKETETDLVEARRKYKIFKIIDRVLWATIYLSVAYYIYSKMNFNFSDIYEKLFE